MVSGWGRGTAWRRCRQQPGAAGQEASASRSGGVAGGVATPPPRQLAGAWLPGDLASIQQAGSTWAHLHLHKPSWHYCVNPASPAPISAQHPPRSRCCRRTSSPPLQSSRASETRNTGVGGGGGSRHFARGGAQASSKTARRQNVRGGKQLSGWPDVTPADGHAAAEQSMLEQRAGAESSGTAGVAAAAGHCALRHLRAGPGAKSRARARRPGQAAPGQGPQQL